MLTGSYRIQAALFAGMLALSGCLSQGQGIVERGSRAQNQANDQDPAPVPSVKPSPSPTASPVPAPKPSPTPSPSPTVKPSPSPSPKPSPSPSPTATAAPGNVTISNPAPPASSSSDVSVTSIVGTSMTLYMPSTASGMSTAYGMSASASTTNGSITLTAWRQVSGPADLKIAGTGGYIRIVPPVIGTYVFRFTATNSLGHSTSIDSTVTVKNYPDNSNANYGLQVACPASWERFQDYPGFGYMEYLPPGYFQNPNKTYPVIVFLHGAGELGPGNMPNLQLLLRGSTGLASIINAGDFTNPEDFIVLSPQTAGYFSVENIEYVTSFFLKHYRIDTSRMYLTGLSYGAMASWDYIAARGDAIPYAAVVPISGKNVAPQLAGCNARSIPIWAFHGTADTNQPTLCILPSQQCGELDSVNAFNACKPNEPAKLTLFRGLGHNVWDMVYSLSGMTSSTQDPNDTLFNQSIYLWMLQHHK